MLYFYSWSDGMTQRLCNIVITMRATQFSFTYPIGWWYFENSILCSWTNNSRQNFRSARKLTQKSFSLVWVWFLMWFGFGLVWFCLLTTWFDFVSLAYYIIWLCLVSLAHYMIYFGFARTLHDLIWFRSPITWFCLVYPNQTKPKKTKPFAILVWSGLFTSLGRFSVIIKIKSFGALTLDTFQR